MSKYKIYISLFVVAAVSFLIAFKFPTEEIIKTIIAAPGVLALFGVIYQIFRDHNTHERNLELQHQQQIFNIGASSHMANIAFDKHVSFCESYLKEIDLVITDLYAHGPTKKLITHAYKLQNLRQSSAAWLTEDINKKIEPFEMALRKIGARKQYLDMTRENTDDEQQRKEIYEFVYSQFQNILGTEDKNTDAEISVEAIKKYIREILDIEDLVKLRKKLIKKAISSIKT